MTNTAAAVDVSVYQVDNALWNAILAKCPFIGAALVSGAPEDPSWSVEFEDEEAARQRAPSAQSLQPGELKQMYEQQVRAHQSQLEQQQALALEKTMDFLQSDPEYLASVDRQQHQLTSQSLRRSHPSKSSRPAALPPDKTHASAPVRLTDVITSHSITPSLTVQCLPCPRAETTAPRHVLPSVDRLVVRQQRSGGVAAVAFLSAQVAQAQARGAQCQYQRVFVAQSAGRRADDALPALVHSVLWSPSAAQDVDAQDRAVRQAPALQDVKATE